MLQYFNFSLLHRHYFISQAKSGFFLWDNVTCFASCKPFYDPGFICLGNYFINMNTNFTVKTNVVYLKFNMFRPPILPQVGSTHRPRRHEWRAKGLPQVWHQRHHQGTFPYYIIPRYYIIQRYLPILYHTKVLYYTKVPSHIVIWISDQSIWMLQMYQQDATANVKITVIIGKY